MLGGEFCHADISSWTIPTATVQTVTSRMVAAFTVASWPGTWDDDEYRDGEVEWLTGDNVGTISPIVGFRYSDRRVTLLRPTPFAIQVGDTAVARVGCDGLFATCKAKFANQNNFGGDPNAPSANAIVEPPAEDQ